MERYGNQVIVDIQVLSQDNAEYLSGFNCGNKSIDQYFNMQARDDETAVTYLFIDCEKDILIACMTIACSAIFDEGEEQEKPLTTILSAMEIKYFAVDDRYKHLPYIKGSPYSLSHYMFIHMLSYMREISHTKIGASKIVLYSVPDAVHFYERCRFKEFGDTMYGDEGTYLEGCVPMYFDLN